MRISSRAPSKRPVAAPVLVIAVASAAWWALPVPGPLAIGDGGLLDAVQEEPEGRAVVGDGGVIPGAVDERGGADERVVAVVDGALEVGRQAAGGAVDAQEPVEQLA